MLAHCRSWQHVQTAIFMFNKRDISFDVMPKSYFRTDLLKIDSMVKENWSIIYLYIYLCIYIYIIFIYIYIFIHTHIPYNIIAQANIVQGKIATEFITGRFCISYIGIL